MILNVACSFASTVPAMCSISNTLKDIFPQFVSTNQTFTLQNPLDGRKDVYLVKRYVHEGLVSDMWWHAHYRSLWIPEAIQSIQRIRQATGSALNIAKLSTILSNLIGSKWHHYEIRQYGGIHRCPEVAPARKRHLPNRGSRFCRDLKKISWKSFFIKATPFVFGTRYARLHVVTMRGLRQLFCRS